MGKTLKLSGGKKLRKQLTMMAVKAKNSALLQVGFPKGSTELDGTPTPLVAFLNEFGKLVRSKDGDYYQLPRPYFRNMIAKGEKHWGADLGKLLIANEYDAVVSLKALGDEMRSELVESIQTLESPPLAPSTIKRKGFSKPLIEHKTMWKSVNSWIEQTK